jgi:hypothetical protein
MFGGETLLTWECRYVWSKTLPARYREMVAFLPAERGD